MRSRVFSLFCRGLFAAALCGRVARAGDAGFEWSATQNPAGNWSYGWASAPGASYQPFTAESTYANGLSLWSAPNGAALGVACFDVHQKAGTFLRGHVGARAGVGGAATVLRWTAASAGSYHVAARCLSAQGYLPGLPGPQPVNGAQAGAAFGRAVAAGDVNGDGYDDVVVGQPLWSNGQASEGRVTLYLGGPDGLNTTAAWSYESNVAGFELGTSVAIGDFDGDGYADLLAGAPKYSVSRGLVYFFRGSGTVPSFVTSVSGGLGTSQAGISCAMGDFDGDGYADAVLGGLDDVQVLRGNPGFSISTGALISVLPAVGVDASYGSAVAVAGDVDGDGRADLLVGDPTLGSGGLTQAGRAFLFFGSALGVGSWSTAWNVAGSANSAKLGTSLSAAGDVNGDGHEDFLVGSTLDLSGHAGRAQLFLGAAGVPGTTAAWTLDGASGSWLASAMTAVGDANGDGFGDFVIGSYGYTNGQSGEGRVQLFLGGPTATPAAGYALEGNQASAQLGAALAAGDVNGDRTRDFVAGAPYFPVSASQVGRVYLVTNAGPAPRPPAYVDARLVVGGVTVARDTIDTPAGRDTLTLEADVALGAGATVDFELADLDPSTPGDLTRLDAKVEPSLTPTGPQGPVFGLAGQRFVPAQGVPAFEALAWDPLARKFATNGHLYDACGNLLSNGPEGPGIAWDPVTRKFWNLSFDAGNQAWVLSSYDTTTLTLTAEVAIPRVLTVPGTGADTLEDARGLAMDSSYVYIVDAGPVNLQPPANAWFRFTRTGTPVASRKGAGFAVNAFDDIVDDIVWAPHASPTAPGMLLVAVEHTGILVLDTAGALADTFTWRAQGVEKADRPAAFAGLALDPASGDLFLADNDRGLAEHWVRLADPGPTSYLVGDGNPMLLQLTGSACLQPMLWEPLPPKVTYCPQSPFIFGLAYRTLDQRVYAIDYGDGTLWRFDPRTGRGGRVGPTDVISVWGLAYDTERDRLYGLEQGASSARVWSISPATAAATPLPNPVGVYCDDIAFEPNGGVIYGVGIVGGTPTLFRIDRDSGAGTPVGPTRGARGLDYDPVRGALLGLGSSDSLWSINPGTGAASLIGMVPPGGGWEGLAVVPVAPFGTVGVPRPPAATGAFVALAAWPRPTRDREHLAFALAAPGDVRLELFDVSGRLVRRLASGWMTAGPHEVDWDGRLATGRAAAAGVYFARLEAMGGAVTSRIVLMR